MDRAQWHKRSFHFLHVVVMCLISGKREHLFPFHVAFSISFHLKPQMVHKNHILLFTCGFWALIINLEVMKDGWSVIGRTDYRTKCDFCAGIMHHNGPQFELKRVSNCTKWVLQLHYLWSINRYTCCWLMLSGFSKVSNSKAYKVSHYKQSRWRGSCPMT